MARDPDYCSTCYSAAKKAGRPVRQTEVYPYPVCTLCETRLRNGLGHYMPSNGTEFDIFLDQCGECRHFTEGVKRVCAFGILDKLFTGMASEYDSATFWFDPADLDGSTCRRFTGRGDFGGELRDPPPPDCVGQLTFDDVTVPEPACRPAAAVAE